MQEPRIWWTHATWNYNLLAAFTPHHKPVWLQYASRGFILSVAVPFGWSRYAVLSNDRKQSMLTIFCVPHPRLDMVESDVYRTPESAVFYMDSLY